MSVKNNKALTPYEKKHLIKEKIYIKLHEILVQLKKQLIAKSEKSQFLDLNSWNRIINNTFKRIIRKAHNEIKQIGIEDKAEMLTEKLTVGQLQKLQVARALALNPRVLLLDEPFAGSSHQEIAEIKDVILNAHERGITVVVIEHVLRELLSISQRLIVLDEGEKIAEGAPKEVVGMKRVIKAYIGTEGGYSVA